MDGGWIQFSLQILMLFAALAVSLVLVLPKIVERFVIEHIKHKHQIQLRETESNLQIYGDILKSAIEAGGASGNELRQRSIKSVEILWNEILRVESEFSSLVGIENITTDEEMNDLVRGNGPSQACTVINEFRDFQTITQKTGIDKASDVSKERLFVSKGLWKSFNALVGIYGRLGILVSYGITDNKKVNWKYDKLMIGLIDGIIPEKELKLIQSMKLSGFKAMAETIRQEFLTEARVTMRGTEEFCEALSEFHSIVSQQEMIAQEERAMTKGRVTNT